MVHRKTNRATPHVEVGGPPHRLLHRNGAAVSSHPGSSMHHPFGSVLPRTDRVSDYSVHVDAGPPDLDVLARPPVTAVRLETDAGARAIKRGIDVVLAS